MSKKRFKILTITAALALIAAIGTSLAYLSAEDSDINTFTVGSVSIDLIEPNWEGANNIKQEELITKDPQVENTGSNSAFVFLKVEIPKKQIYIYNSSTKMRYGEKPDGTAPKYLTELFQLGSSDIEYTTDWCCKHSINNNWALVSTDKTQEEYNTYYYVYGTKTAMKKLDAGATTPALFETLRYSTGVEGQTLDEGVHHIKINAYAIQSDDLGGNDTAAPREVWKLIANQVYGADKNTLP